MVARDKKRLDIMLVERGLAESRHRAQALIMAGHVIVNDVAETKAGHAVAPDAVITLRERNPYVSRGGQKLESALVALGISVRDKTCMDIGASTGGFTDCLLQHGARLVYAIDVGHGQLHPKLAHDERVISIEGANFRYFSIQSLKHPIQFATIDVSFISLEKILPVVYHILLNKGEVLALIKPQFEAGPFETSKGVVKDETIRQKAIEKIRCFSVALGFSVTGSVDSAVKGPRGNREHFLWLSK